MALSPELKLVLIVGFLGILWVLFVLYLAFSHPRSQSRPQWAIEQEGGLGSGLRFVRFLKNAASNPPANRECNPTAFSIHLQDPRPSTTADGKSDDRLIESSDIG